MVEICVFCCKFLKTRPNWTFFRIPIPLTAEPFRESWLYVNFDVWGNGGGGSAGGVDTTLERGGEDMVDIEGCEFFAEVSSLLFAAQGKRWVVGGRGIAKPCWVDKVETFAMASNVDFACTHDRGSVMAGLGGGRIYFVAVETETGGRRWNENQ